MSLLRYELDLEESKVYETQEKYLWFPSKWKPFLENSNQEDEILWNELDPTVTMLVCWSKINV